jgi:hypothetical protein
MKPLALLAASLACLCASVEVAGACSLVMNHRWMPDGMPPDDTTPPTVTVTGWHIGRAFAGDWECGDAGAVYVDIVATDDQSDPRFIAYRTVALSGNLDVTTSPPNTLEVVDHRDAPLVYFFNPYAPLIDTELEITPIDRNNNEGAPVRVRIVEEPPPPEEEDTGGCAAGGGGGIGGGALLLALAAVVRMMRR